MPVNEISERHSELVATPFLGGSLEIFICLNHVEVAILGMERKKNSTAKDELLRQESLHFFVLILQNVIRYSELEESS